MKQGTLTLNNPTSNISFSITGEPVSQGETWLLNEFLQRSPYAKNLFPEWNGTFTINNISVLEFSIARISLSNNNAKIEIAIGLEEGGYIYNDTQWNDSTFVNATTYALTPWKIWHFSEQQTGDLLTWLQANAVLTGNISSGSFSGTTINSATITGGSFLDCTIGDPDPETAAPQQGCEISGGQFKYTTWDAFKVRVLQNQLQSGYGLVSIGDDWYEVQAV